MQLASLLSLLPLVLFLRSKDLPRAFPQTNSCVPHALKSLLCVTAAGLELVMLIWHLTQDSSVDLSQVTVNCLSCLEWTAAGLLVVLQYIQEKRTKRYISAWWKVMLFAQLLVLPLTLIFSVGHPSLEDTSLEEVLLLALQLALVLLNCCYSDPSLANDEWSIHSNSILTVFAGSRKMSEEEVYRSLALRDEDENGIHAVEVLSTTVDVCEEAVMAT